MYRIFLIVFAIFLLVFWLYPKESRIPAEDDACKRHPIRATSKVEIQKVGGSGIDPVFNENFEFKNTELSTSEIFALATELRLCKSVPKSDSELSLWLDKANSLGEPIEFIDDTVARYEQCLKHSNEERNYMALLLNAAEQGSDDAVSLLWSIGEQEYFESFGTVQFSREERIAARVAFTQKKYDLAHKVALQGGEHSVEKLVKGYQHFDPATNGQSYYKSVAYANYTMATTRNNDLYRKVDWIKQRLLNSMSNDELEQAQMLTEKLLSESLTGQNE
ncbi:hypothetical protein [Alishewanella longhuensis]